MYVYAILSTYWKFNVNLHNVLLLTMMMRTYKWSGSFWPFSVRLWGFFFRCMSGSIAWLGYSNILAKERKMHQTSKQLSLLLITKQLMRMLVMSITFIIIILNLIIFFKVQRWKDEVRWDKMLLKRTFIHILIVLRVPVVPLTHLI